MNSKLSVIQKLTYLQNPTLCPYCEGENIEGSSIEINNGIAVQNIGCNDCDNSWNDIYTLTKIEEIK